MKRMVSVILLIFVIFGLAACNGIRPSAGNQADNEQQKKEYKIGIITGTVFQNEEEYQAAQKLKASYGESVITATYPDDFLEKKEQTIATVSNMAADPTVKVIVFAQTVPGVAEAIETVKESRDDILFIAGACTEEVSVIGAAADICISVDEKTLGTAMVDQAAKQGAKTFVYISFQRHLENDVFTQQKELVEKRCNELQIKFVGAEAPDPLGDTGVIGVQTWFVENIKNYIDECGIDTAFYCTNCAMQEALITQVAQLGAIYPVQCCPSPYHGYPDAFDISLEGYEDDIPYILDQIALKIKDYGNQGRMSTWAVPANAAIIDAGFQYGKMWMEGSIESRCDETALITCLKETFGEGVTIRKDGEDLEEGLENYFVITCPFYDF